jgi:hypothetical protein
VIGTDYFDITNVQALRNKKAPPFRAGLSLVPVGTVSVRLAAAPSNVQLTSAGILTAELSEGSESAS